MSDPFRPNFASADDLPEGFNDLSEVERRQMLAERLRLLHVYGQSTWHGELTIIGNRNALTVLRDAIDAAIASGKAGTTAMVADGEGFAVEIEMDDSPWQEPGWKRRELPYSDPVACGRPDPLWYAQRLEYALRQANAELFKRGAKPVPMPLLDEGAEGGPA